MSHGPIAAASYLIVFMLLNGLNAEFTQAVQGIQRGHGGDFDIFQFLNNNILDIREQAQLHPNRS